MSRAGIWGGVGDDTRETRCDVGSVIGAVGLVVGVEGEGIRIIFIFIFFG